MAAKMIWGKLRNVISDAISIGVFGLNSFILLLLKSQSDKAMVYVICVITIAYLIVLTAGWIAYRKEPEKLSGMVAPTRLIFRWIYVALYLTIIIINMTHAGWNGSVDFSDGKLVYQMIMFVFIALTVPRDILLQKALAWAKQKWTRFQNEQKRRVCNASIF